METDLETEPARSTGDGVDAKGRERIPGHEVEALFTRFRPALTRYFERRRFAFADAEDMTQEVFLRIARLCGAQHIRQPSGFVFQTAANVLRDRVRRDAARHDKHHVSYEESDFEPEVPSEEAVYEDREALDGFLGALAELSPKCRTVFLLHKYEGLSYMAVAERLAISVSAVEKHMMNAIRHIRGRRSER